MTRPRSTDSPPRHVVAIGASAGGLEALQSFVAGLQPGGTSAYVVAQHLAPDHRSLIVDLLARSSRLPVVTASEGMPLAADVIAVAPAHHDVVIENGLLRVREPGPRFGPSPSVDLLFESLAADWKEHGVAVVLSGTGSDGARGLRAVRGVGGLTVAQAPASAKFEGMPNAAITIGGAELILEPGLIGPRIAALLAGGMGSSAAEAVQQPASLASVVARLRHVTGIDVAEYKESTLRRQLQRRMALRQIGEIDHYLAVLEAEPEEARALLRNLLVTVTSFFRDPAAFEALAVALSAYLSSRPGSGPLRVWVPGCGTGEEVYSLAMVLSAALNHPADLAGQLKIFGTDLDEQSLAVARRGLYTLTAAPLIPADLRDRFTTQQEGELVINERLRACAVFACHNVAQDPPFPRLDLISCRNTLIYFTPPMQERVLAFFRFSLLPGGLLFLGMSESPGTRSSDFEPLDRDHHLYRCTGKGSGRTRPALVLPAQRPPWPTHFGRMGVVVRESVPEQHVNLLTAVARGFCPPSLILDEEHQVVEVIGDVAPFCRLPEGRLSTLVHAFLPAPLQNEARALLLLAPADGEAVRSPPLRLSPQEMHLHLEVRVLTVGENRMKVLSFVREPDGVCTPAVASAGVPVRDPAFDREIERLEGELLDSQTSLRRSMAELEAANEELEASAEELQASAEELQSSNEELVSSNEELQATNEELGTLNQQLRIRTDELQMLSTDLENIQNSLNQGMLIVDRDLRVSRFSPLAVRVFALMEADLGQSLLGVPTTLPIPGLEEALRAVVAGEPRRTLEAGGEDVAYLLQVMPYLEQEGRRRGAIVTLTDVSELVALRRAAEASLQEFTRLTDALPEAVWKRDLSLGRLLYASRRFQAITGWTPAELCADVALLDEAIDPADRERVRAGRNLQGEGWLLRYRLRTRDGCRIWVEEAAKVMRHDSDCCVVGTLADVTAAHREQEQTRQRSALYEAVHNCCSFGVAVLDPQLRVLRANRHLAKLTGRDAEAIAGLTLADLTPELDEPARILLAQMADASGGPAPASSQVRTSLLRWDGSSREVELELMPLARNGEDVALLLLLRTLEGTVDGKGAGPGAEAPGC